MTAAIARRPHRSVSMHGTLLEQSRLERPKSSRRSCTDIHQRHKPYRLLVRRCMLASRSPNPSITLRAFISGHRPVKTDHEKSGNRIHCAIRTVLMLLCIY